MLDKGLYLSQWIVISAILFGLFCSANSAEAGNWQQEMLFHPTVDQLQLESEGQIEI